MGKPTQQGETTMTRTTTPQLILEIMATRSGTTYLAREIGQILSNVYNRGASPKSISKQLLQLTTENPMIKRRQTTNKEKASFNCRFIYKWGLWDEPTET